MRLGIRLLFCFCGKREVEGRLVDIGNIFFFFFIYEVGVFGLWRESSGVV